MTNYPGTEWQVESVASVTDGDTVRLIRSRVVEIDGRSYRITDDEPKGIPIRLVWVDTPERGQHPGWEKARDDLREWLAPWMVLGSDGRPMTDIAGQLRVVCYESGGWDRLMGDLLDTDGNSASQWLMTERGWPPYVKGK